MSGEHVLKYRFTISKGMAGRVSKRDHFEDFEKPRYGFCWWFWLPKYQSNHGTFSRNEVVDVDVVWLCFWFGFIFWPNKSK